MAEEASRLSRLEIAHKQHLISLIQTALFRLGLAEKFGINSAEFDDYNSIFNDSLASWLRRNNWMEQKSKRKTLPEWIYKEQGGNWLKLFNTNEGVTKLVKLAAELDPERKGISFIPLIIWAVISIVAYFTVSEVVNAESKSIAEQKDLVKQTDDFCTNHNLTADQCKDILKQQTESIDKDKDKESLGDTFKSLLFWGGLGFVAFKFVLPSLTKSNSATT